MNSTGATMWLAVVEDGELIDTTPYRLDVGAGLEKGQQLVALLADCKRVLTDLSPDSVVVLEPEAMGKFTFRQSRDRVTGEVLLSVAAAQLDVPCRYVSRPTVKSRLGLGSAGKLVSHVESVVPSALSPHWKGKRDLAALVALSGEEDTNAAG